MSKLIAEKYSNDNISNNILSKEIFEKYSPCKSKYIASSPTKKYISNKLDRAIRLIKYDNMKVADVVDKKMINDIWGALCPLLDEYHIDTPKGLSKDVLSIIEFKTKAYTTTSNKKKMNSTYHDSEESANESSESDTESDKESDKKSTAKNTSDKKVKDNAKKVKDNEKKVKDNEKKVKATFSKKVKSKPIEESASDSDSDSD